MSSTLSHNPYLAVRQAFDAPWPGPRGEKVILQNGSLSATIYPEDGCRLTSLTAFGYELLRQWNPQRRAFQYGSFPMIPWVGRLGAATLSFNGETYSLPMNKPPHALHGMSCFAPWEIVKKTATCAEFIYILHDPWPWSGQVKQMFELQADAITITLTITSDKESFPAAAGWHPWFNKWISGAENATAVLAESDKNELQIKFNADWQEESDNNELPTGNRIPPMPGPWDDCFGFNSAMGASLIWPDKVRLDMSSPSSSMVIFNKQPDAACVEPLSGPPNGVNTAPELVTKDKPLIVTTTWVMSKI